MPWPRTFRRDVGSDPHGAHQDPPGALGRYELSHLVARGGMAEVYRAHDQLLDRPVALKVLFPELSVDRSFVERFRREAQAAANLSHPNIVPVFDWGEDGGTYFIVMEFVDGRALSSILRTAGPLHPDRAAEIAADVAGSARLRPPPRRGAPRRQAGQRAHHRGRASSRSPTSASPAPSTPRRA